MNHNVSIPVGTTHFTFYARASDAPSTHEERMHYGTMVAVGLRRGEYNGNDGIRFRPVPICTSTASQGGSAKGQALLALLNELVNVTSSEPASENRWPTTRNANLQEAFRVLSTLTNASSFNVQYVLGLIYPLLEASPGQPGYELGQLLMQTIDAHCAVPYDPATERLTLADAYQGFPADLHLPEGAARLMWDDATQRFVQPDIQNQGYAAGTAAAMAVKSGVKVRDIDVKSLQRHLAEKKILRSEDLSMKDNFPLSDETLDAAVAQLANEYRGLPEVFADRARTLPRLRGAFRAAEGEAKLIYAHVLAMFGNDDGAQQLLAKREMMRKHQSNTATARRYQDMYYRVQRNTALSKFNTSFDVAQHYVWQLAKVYDYETGLLSSDRQAGDAFLREIVATRALGEKGVSVVAEGTDGGLWDIVSRMKGNWEVLKGRLGVNNQDASTKWFSLRYSLFRINPGSKGDAAWRQELAKYAVDDIFADSEVLRYCQKTQGAAVPLKEPGLIIPFSTSINSAENFFGKPLLGGETTYSSSYYAVKINSVGVSFAGYDALTVQSSEGLSVEPDIYLVPVGSDYMRTPSGTSRETLAFNVVDQVLPLPYAVGSTELDDTDWLATFSGLDGTVDSMATIRRHSTMRVGAETTSSRLVGRSVWNDRWLLVIPASSLSSDRVNALKTFINGLDTDKDGHIDIPGINDIKIGIRAYSRQGN